MRQIAASALFLFTSIPLFPQTTSDGTFKSRIQLRATYRDSKEPNLSPTSPFPPTFPPVGPTVGF